jgi:hypothetical protein
LTGTAYRARAQAKACGYILLSIWLQLGITENLNLSTQPEVVQDILKGQAGFMPAQDKA